MRTVRSTSRKPVLPVSDRFQGHVDVRKAHACVPDPRERVFEPRFPGKGRISRIELSKLFASSRFFRPIENGNLPLPLQRERDPGSTPTLRLKRSVHDCHDCHYCHYCHYCHHFLPLLPSRTRDFVLTSSRQDPRFPFLPRVWNDVRSNGSSFSLSDGSVARSDLSSKSHVTRSLIR